MSRTPLLLGLIVAACGGESSTAPSPPPNPATASLPIQITTSGIDPGTTSFEVVIDSVAVRQAAVNGTTTLKVTPGRHLVRLHRLPSHCQIALPAGFLTEFGWQRTVEVFTPAAAVFSVECFLTGSLQVELHTSGNHAPSLFIAFLDKHPAWLLELPINGSVTVRNVRTGDHQLSISTGPNCAVSDPKLGNRLNVDIVPSQVTTVSIPITCN